jgi:positive regulator of sigma E activity
MLNDLIKNAGLFIILIGIIILVISFLNGITGNSGLIAAFIMIVVGFLTFLLTNRYMEN